MSKQNKPYHKVALHAAADEGGTRITELVIDDMELRNLLHYDIQHHDRGLVKVTVTFIAETQGGE